MGGKIRYLFPAVQEDADDYDGDLFRDRSGGPPAERLLGDRLAQLSRSDRGNAVVLLLFQAGF